MHNSGLKVALSVSV